MDTQSVHIVWLKRDLRLSDHLPIKRASELGRVLLVYILEPSMMDDEHYSGRHWRFVIQSLDDMRNRLKDVNTEVLFIQDEVEVALENIMTRFRIGSMHSHEETGLAKTYARDKGVREWCSSAGIRWYEYQNGGVRRGLKNRRTWRKDWYSYMTAPIHDLDIATIAWVSRAAIQTSDLMDDYPSLGPGHHFQMGGETEGRGLLDSFLKDRVGQYITSISSPSASREGCSRLSPYLAWGCLSIREVYQRQKSSRDTSPSIRGLQGFASRLRWQAHFIQKFEMEDRMEMENVNRGFDRLDKPIRTEWIRAWEEGKTGYPLVDACMRCLCTTGYVNFRMRAMLVSFLTHHLWQPWQVGSAHLARQFLDFEPGIHFPQFQMQAGMTGINTLRIYNPIKQAEDHDTDAVFIKEWVPELRGLPALYAREPWQMTEMEAMMYDFRIGHDYPPPIVDVKLSAKQARDAIWRVRKQDSTRKESQRILSRHTIPGRRNA